MQTAIDNPCKSIFIPANSHQLRVFHATRNIQMEFDPSMTAEWGVAYAYCEENKRLSQLFSHREAGTLPEMYAKLPMTYGKRSVACGDWMACVRQVESRPSQVVTAGDIQNVLEQYSLRVTDTKGKAFETMAAELVDTLDLTSVISAAATGDTLPAKQQAIFDALHQLLVKERIIEF